MEPYAIVQTGGKQYMVRPGTVFRAERLPADEGSKVELAPVLARSNGQTLEIGKPEIASARVSCAVLKHIRGPKVVSFKKKRRKGYTRKQGHRQELTVLRVESIS